MHVRACQVKQACFCFAVYFLSSIIFIVFFFFFVCKWQCLTWKCIRCLSFWQEKGLSKASHGLTPSHAKGIHWIWLKILSSLYVNPKFASTSPRWDTFTHKKPQVWHKPLKPITTEIEMEYTTFEPYEWRMHPLNQLVILPYFHNWKKYLHINTIQHCICDQSETNCF